MIFTIKKNKHRSGINFRPHFKITEVEFKVKFLTSLWYLKEEVEHTGVNKLCGFSFGCHHRYSIRIGWQPDFNNEGVIVFYVYMYKNGERIIKEIFRSKIQPQSYVFVIQTLNDSLKIYLDDVMIYQDIYAKPESEWGYYLYPYFGGKSKAPKEFKFKIIQTKI